MRGTPGGFHVANEGSLNFVVGQVGESTGAGFMIHPSRFVSSNWGLAPLETMLFIYQVGVVLNITRLADLQ